MIAPDLPAELKATLDAKLQGVSRTHAATRAAALSKTYRAGGRAGRPRGGELRDRRARRSRTPGARGCDVGKAPRHAVDRRARNARRLRENHCAAATTDLS